MKFFSSAWAYTKILGWQITQIHCYKTALKGCNAIQQRCDHPEYDIKLEHYPHQIHMHRY